MLRFAGYKSRMTAIDSPITMRSSLKAIGMSTLALAAFGVAQAIPPASEPATAPASRPVATATTVTAVPPVTAVSLKSLLQLRLYDGQLALYTNHPPTIGQITVRLDDPPVTAQLRIISRSQQSPPYRPDAFAVGVDIFGVANWLRTLEGIPAWWEAQREALYQEIGNPQTQREMLVEISPAFHGDKITKPLMVLQGKNDPRVLQAESDDLVAAARKNGTPVEYIVFDDEGHGFSKKKNQIDGYGKVLVFLDKYLKNAPLKKS